MLSISILSIVAALILASKQFDFQQLTVYPNSAVVGVVTQYTITFQRFIDNNNNETPWNTTQVTGGSSITVVFPSEYTISSPTFLSVTVSGIAATGFNFTTSGNTITINGAIPVAANVYNVELVIGNILNPVPAVQTGEFQGTIGIDVAVPAGAAFVQLSAANFKNCSVTFDLAYVNRTSTMVVTLEPRNSLGPGATVVVAVPLRWTNDIQTNSQLPITSTMNCVNYSAAVSASPMCNGYLANTSIVASSLFVSPVSTSFAFGITQMMSPPTLQASDSITITSFINGYKVDTCTAYVSGLLPNPIYPIITPLSTMQVNSNVGLKIQITLSDFMNLYDQVVVIFPSEIVPTFVNLSGAGSYSNPTGYLNAQTLTTNHLTINRIFNKGSVYTLNFHQIKAPPSTLTSNPIMVQVTRNGALKMSGSATIQAVASTVTGSVSAVVATVNKVTNYNINIVITDGLTSAGMIQITFPPSITPTLSSNCATLIGNNVVNSPTCNYNNVLNTITLTNMNSSTANIGGSQTLKLTVLSVKNAPSILTSASFTVKTYYTGSTNSMVSQGSITGISASLDILDSSKILVIPSSYVVSDTLVTYTISFVIGNAIPSGGFIQLTIPSPVVLNIANISNYCKLAFNSSIFVSTQCSGNTVAGGYYVNFSNPSSSSSLLAGTNISIQISSLFTNPPSTAVVSTFTIKTSSSDGSGIQQLTSGITIQMVTPSTFTSMLVTRSSTANSDASASYTIKLKQTPSLPAASKLSITFPTQISITNAIVCTDLSGTAINCTQSANTVSLAFPSLVSPATQFGIIVLNAINPPSFSPLSSAFQFATSTTDNMISYASGSYTPTFQNDIPSAFTSISGVFSSGIYGESTDLQITVTPSGRIIPSYMLVTIPGSFSIPSSLSCSTWSCSVVSSNLLKVNNITSTSQITFTVTGMIAPQSANTNYITVGSYYNIYKVDENNNKILFAATCVLPCRTCITTNSSACLSCYSNTNITTLHYLYALTYTCYSTCPSFTYLDISTSKCLDCSTQCLTCAGSSTNCTSCNSSSNLQYLFVNASAGSCRNQCPIYYFADTSQAPAVCSPCLPPCLTCNNVTACTSCKTGYYYNLGCPSSCPSGTHIANDDTHNCDPCSTQCGTCAGTVNTCLTCAQKAALYEGNCVSVCPSPYVVRNGNCSSCSSTCLTCSIAYDNCTSCFTNSSLPYLYNYTCLPVCPIFYYSSLANGLCILCSTLGMGCDNCTSSSTCGTCNWAQGYVFLNNRCYLVTPLGYYNSSGYALLCDASKDCATCYGQSYNCTACISLNLEGNTCVGTCMAGYVGINKQCVSCTNNCKTCSNLQSNCTSCVANASTPVFLSNYQCVTVCPDYTYANVTNNQCTPCTSNCEKCTSSSQCISCLPSFYLMNTTCNTTCPYGYFGINRNCTRCSPPCDFCSLTLATCTTCLPTYFLVAATNTCTQNCPTGLFKNAVQGACTGCESPCNTCSSSANTCASCSGALNLFNSTCIPQCHDGYYPLNNICENCNPNCSTCSSATVCTTCINGLYFYSNSCLAKCPSTNPVISAGKCVACSDANCISCDSLDQCTDCDYPTLLLSGHCLTSCPTNYTSNGTHCNYDPQSANTTNTTEQTLSSTLTSANLFPVPFTIAAAFIGMACIMSRFQHPSTFIPGSLFALWSLLEMGSIATAAYFYYQSIKSTVNIKTSYVEAFVFIAAVAFLYLLNLFALIIQNCFLRLDSSFQKWQNKQFFNRCFYYLASVIGVTVTHKFKNIIFCNLFGFEIFKAKLQTVQKFRIFNIFSFLSFLSSAAILFAASMMIYMHHLPDQQLMAYIDVIVLTVACILLAIFNSRKADDFFEEKEEQGIILHKRINQSDFIMREAIIPFMAEEQQLDRGNMKKTQPVFETERKFKNSMDTISDSPSSYRYEYVKQKQNISVQAAPMLQDYSKIGFFDEEASELSIFKKVDRSVDMTKRHGNEVSIQNDGNVLDVKEISIQYNPHQNDASIQHNIDAKDISMQNVPNQDQVAVQMTRNQQDHSIQCVVLANDASIQYSAKPIFENISQDFKGSDQQQVYGDQQNQGMAQMPAEDPKVLKAQLQLDVDQKLRRKAEQEQLERQEQIQKQKQQMIRKFHLQSADNTKKQSQSFQKSDNERQAINKIYNNDISNPDGSSLMDSNADLMNHFKQKPKQFSHSKQQMDERAQSAKTQKQFIQMLSNNGEGQLQLQSEMSFNVTRDLQQAKDEKIKKVIFEVQDKQIDSQDNNLEMQSQQKRENHEAYILQNDANEQIPSGFEKSRSTNFLSSAKDGRRPPLPNRTESKNLLDQSSNMDNSMPENDQQINNNPIQPMKRHPKSLYKEEDLNYEAKTNLTQFLGKKKKVPPVSAQSPSKYMHEENIDSDQIYSYKRQSKQKPLIQPRKQTLQSQQSLEQPNQKKFYKMNSKKILMEDKKLEFDSAQKIQFNTQQMEGQMPKVLQTKKRYNRSKSQNRNDEMGSYQKSIHRQLLGKERFADRTEKYLQKQLRKVQNTKKKIQMMEVMLERPNLNQQKGYMRETHSSQDKKKKSQLEKIYLNNPFDKKP